MRFTEDTVRKVAELARLQLTPEETARFATQLGKVLEYIEKLNALDTSKVEPLTHALDITQPMRADASRPGPGTEAMMEGAPEHAYESYKVPQVLK